MSEYREIQGAAVQSLASNTGTIEGQIWYDNVNGAFKLQGFSTGTWSSGANYPLPGYVIAGAGTSTDAHTGSIRHFPGPNAANNTHATYDGASWTSITGRPNTTYYSGASRNSPSGSVFFAGGDPRPAANYTDEWNASAWTSGGTLPVAGAIWGQVTGTLNDAISVGGATASYPPAPTTTIAYDGTSWTSFGAPSNSNNAVFYKALVGTPSSALLVSATPTSGGETWDGSTWTTSPATLNTNRGQLMGGGASSTDAVVFGGEDGAPKVASTEVWDGTSFTTSGNLSAARDQAASGGVSTNGAFANCGETPTGGTSATEEFTYGVATQTITTT